MQQQQEREDISDCSCLAITPFFGTYHCSLPNHGLVGGVFITVAECGWGHDADGNPRANTSCGSHRLGEVQREPWAVSSAHFNLLVVAE